VTQIEPTEKKLKHVWNQKDVPVILRRDGKRERLRLRLPYADDNKTWLECGQKSKATWNEELSCWEIPKSWFNEFVEKALNRYMVLYVIQPYREQQICSRSCQDAVGHECECSCMGANHGIGSDGSWFEVNETFATKWGDSELACRLMVKKQDSD